MQLTDEDVREFAALWQQEFDENLSPDAAKYHASQLMRVYQVLVRFPRDSEPDRADGTVQRTP